MQVLAWRSIGNIIIRIVSLWTRIRVQHWVHNPWNVTNKHKNQRIDFIIVTVTQLVYLYQPKFLLHKEIGMYHNELFVITEFLSHYQSLC